MERASDVYSSYEFLAHQPQLLVQCVACDCVEDTRHNMMALSATSKVFNKAINTLHFFQGLNVLLDPNPHRQHITAGQTERALPSTIKERLQALRECFQEHPLLEKSEFPGVTNGSVCINGEKIEIISLKEGNLCELALQEGSEASTLSIPEEWELDAQLPIYDTIHSDKFIIFHQSVACSKKSLLCVLGTENSEFNRKYEIEGNIAQKKL